MKKGFTLIELLAILALLGVIILVSVPSIISTNKQSEENNYKQFIANIKNAAEIYVETHEETYSALKTTPGVSETIEIEKLIKGNYIKSTLQNPKTEKTISEEKGTITVKNEDGKLVYTYNAN